VIWLSGTSRSTFFFEHGLATILDTDMSALLVVELTPAIVARAQSLLKRHPLRAGDAIHLASCLHLQEQLQEQSTFIAFDDRLIAAARLEGLALG
jgi:predicted nucleic acid-binding protein